MIISERHKFKFYFSVIFVSIVFIGFALISLYAFVDLYKEGKIQPKNYFLPFISGGCLLLSLYSIFRYFKNAPKIELDLKSFKIKYFSSEVSYSYSEIENIEMTGKIPFKYVINFPAEGVSITLRNGKIIFLYDDMYSNIWQIKSFLNDVVINKTEPKDHSDSKIDDSIIDYEFMDLYKGNQFTSMRGIMLWGFILFFVLLFLIKGGSPPIGFYIFMLTFGAFWFLFNSYLMHYVGIDKEYLIIRNHNLIWINKVYYIPEIKEIVFETQGKMPNCLRVITKNFKSKLFPAGTLRDKDWLSLKDELEKRNVIVRNECIY